MILRTIEDKMSFLTTRETLFIHELKVLINIDALLSGEVNLMVMREILLNQVEESGFLQVDYGGEVANEHCQFIVLFGKELQVPE
jgi:hypothetical protein